MPKRTLWLFLSTLDNPDIPLVVPSLAWIARDAGVSFECYLEAERNGALFARTGSTVLGGHHHQQFNYLNNVFDIRYILYGDTTLFTSSVHAFGADVLAEASSPVDLYARLLSYVKNVRPNALLFTPNRTLHVHGQELEIAPYLFPEIYYRKALAFPPDMCELAQTFITEHTISECVSIYLTSAERQAVRQQCQATRAIDTYTKNDTYGALTLRIAERWKHQAKGLVFGDPAAILSQLPAHCRHDRVAVYAPKERMPSGAVRVSAYAEEVSAVTGEVIRLAKEIGNPVITGRQTGDGDLFAWSTAGICMQIIDPNRPAFPIVETVPHPWVQTSATPYDDEPDDATLQRYGH